MMKSRAVLLLKALLKHQKNIHDKAAIERKINKYTITYGELCVLAGIPGHEIGIGPDLLEINKWCVERNIPPLNDLVVNSITRLPGEGIKATKDGGLNWPKNVIECARYDKYPEL